MIPPILPGSAIGVLGSGQLGRMFAIAARQMGYRVHTFSPEYDTPTGQVADVEITAGYDNLEALREMARAVDVITFEFENVPAEAARAASELVPLRPGSNVLYVTQNRFREKSFLVANGFPVTPYAHVETAEALVTAADVLGFPLVLKTSTSGYDGKGQAIIRSAEECSAAWTSLNTSDSIVEKLVDLDRELSVVVARALDGSMEHFDVTQNDHRNHILDISVAPADIDSALQERAVSIARGIAEKLEVTGVICIELFLTRGGELLVNELAPRPHNSGHWTVDGAVTSQFEQQLRAICGLPLGSTLRTRPVAMINLLGDLWSNGEPDWTAACAFPDVKLHLYGKLEPRPGRKMGHLTAVASSTREARALVMSARESLKPRVAGGRPPQES